MTLRIGSLFSGYGGLDQGVQAVLGGTTAWVSDIDPGATRVLTQRFPDAPNLGDIAAIDWSTVAPVDVITGGFPCQDLSLAGRRAGLTPDTRSGLWAHMARAIDTLRPRLVVIENVRGLLSASADPADSGVELCPWCVGGTGDGEPPLRALGCVLADLADLGYDARWCGLRAADVGAPHGRYRIFIVAYPDTVGLSWARGARVRWDGSADDGDAPTDANPPGSQGSQSAGIVGGSDAAVSSGQDWGAYEPAVARWAAVLGRPAPAPTVDGRLSPVFVEWMMGVPAGWVTDVPGLTRAAQLMALGNGVVPLQATVALRRLLGRST